MTHATKARTGTLDDIATDSHVFSIIAMDQRNTLRRMFTAVGLDALGGRGYRAAHLEAGIAAGRLALNAVALAHGATGLTFPPRWPDWPNWRSGPASQAWCARRRRSVAFVPSSAPAGSWFRASGAPPMRRVTSDGSPPRKPLRPPGRPISWWEGRLPRQTTRRRRTRSF